MTTTVARSVGVAFDGVVKAFGAVQVLHGVSFELAPGRVVGLLGENGAGKSTLMKILSGYESATGGEVRIDGTPVKFDGPRAAEARGIVMIHQEFALADVSIAAHAGVVHALCGENGAGKSTLMKILAGARLEAHPVQRLDAGEDLADVVELQGSHFRGPFAF